jgi:hypothetical protein
MAEAIAVQVRLACAERIALDEFRRRQENPPSRPAAVRKLMRRALQVEGATAGRPNGEAA